MLRQSFLAFGETFHSPLMLKLHQFKLVADQFRFVKNDRPVLIQIVENRAEVVRHKRYQPAQTAVHGILLQLLERVRNYFRHVSARLHLFQAFGHFFGVTDNYVRHGRQIYRIFFGHALAGVEIEPLDVFNYVVEKAYSDRITRLRINFHGVAANGKFASAGKLGHALVAPRRQNRRNFLRRNFVADVYRQHRFFKFLSVGKILLQRFCGNDRHLSFAFQYFCKRKAALCVQSAVADLFVKQNVVAGRR